MLLIYTGICFTGLYRNLDISLIENLFNSDSKSINLCSKHTKLSKNQDGWHKIRSK